MKKSTPLTTLAAIASGGVLLPSACGGGGDGMSMAGSATIDCDPC
jgi:hypothetical protein